MAIELEILGKVELILPGEFAPDSLEADELMAAWKNQEIEFFFYHKNREPMKILFPETTSPLENVEMFFDLYKTGKAKIFYRGGVFGTIAVGDQPKKKRELPPFIKRWFGKDA